MQHVYLLTLPQSFASGGLGAQDLLNADRDLLQMVDGRDDDAPAFRTLLVGSQARIGTTYGPSLTMDRTIDDAPPADVVYVAPLAVPPDAEPVFEPGVLEWLRAQYDGGALVCSACTGTLPLAASGLLDGEPATTHWAFADLFRASYPAVDLRIQRTLVVGGDDHRLVTAGAHASWHDLMLYLIHRFAGAAAARRTARVFLLDWHELDQNAYASFREHVQHEDPVVHEAQAWLKRNLSRPDAIQGLGEYCGLPQRSLQRRFRRATGHTPLRYLQHLRVEQAKDLLESLDLAVEDVGWRVGYEDAAHFRRLFGRITGLTPAKYRKAFRTPAHVTDMLP